MKALIHAVAVTVLCAGLSGNASDYGDAGQRLR